MTNATQSMQDGHPVNLVLAVTFTASTLEPLGKMTDIKGPVGHLASLSRCLTGMRSGVE